MAMNTTLTSRSITAWMSVRKYEMAALPDDILAEIQSFCDHTEALDASIACRFILLEPEAVLGLGKADAPHYLALYSAEAEDCFENAGYRMQQVQLFLSQNDIGSCLWGMGRPKINDQPEGTEGMELQALISFGKSEGNMHRTSVEQFKRKRIDQICSNADCIDLVEYARLAQSAGNSQPWFFAGDAQCIDIYCELAGDIFNTENSGLKKLDLGIAMYNLVLASQLAGRFNGFSKTPSGAAKPTQRGLEYNRSLLLKN